MIKTALLLALLVNGSFIPLYAQLRSGLIINEIMANPNSGQLPLYEYLELYNNSEEVILLEEFRLSVGANTIDLPAYHLSPKQYVLLCSEAASASYQSYGNVLSLPRWYALNNSSGNVSLYKDGHIQDDITYSDTWYGTTAKRRGGWSLERINPNIMCSSALNWSASVNPMGGTPCRANSIRTTEPPQVRIVDWDIAGEKLSIAFDQEVLANLDLTDAKFDLHPVGHAAREVQISAADGIVMLSFPFELQYNTLYHLTISGMRWCGHELISEDLTLFHQGAITYNDVVINEVLFNPKPGGADFVEILNRSTYPINLQHWYLGNRLISSDILLLAPQQHLALTISPSTLMQHYPTEQPQSFHQMASLPSYPNQQGNVLLYAGNMLIDSLYYNASFHQPFLKNVKGISLERHDPHTATNALGNFRSASTMSGGATPGYQNSTDSRNFEKNNLFFLSSKTMSPDGDSFEDELEINYELESPHLMMSVDIYSDKGTIVNRLIRQKSAGLSGKITWDGRAENGHLCRPGIYIYQVELYDDKGYLKTIKGAFVLTYMGAGT